LKSIVEVDVVGEVGKVVQVVVVVAEGVCV
jgi:hypothetical protein